MPEVKGKVGVAIKGSMWGPGADGTLLYLDCISVNTLAVILCKITVGNWQRVLGSFYILTFICMWVYNDLKTNDVYKYRGRKTGRKYIRTPLMGCKFVDVLNFVLYISIYISMTLF